MSHLLFAEEDPFAPLKYYYPVEELICSLTTRYNKIMVVKSPYFGKMLILNDVVQLTEWDEYLYHEMLVHVPLHAHPSPRNILIIGGGDGGTLREVLKHETVKKAVLVEIDQEVIEVSKNHLPALSTGFADERTHVVVMDGAEFFARSDDKFDVIIVDSTDPVGTAESLYTSRFLADVFSALENDGIFVAQTESLHFHKKFVSDVQHRLSEQFNIVDLYTVPLATYAGNWWTFSTASKKYDPKKAARKCVIPTRYYAEDVHSWAFLPPSLYKKLGEA